MFRFLIGLISLTMLASCQSREESFYAEDVPTSKTTNGSVKDLPDYLTDIGTININTLANGNYTGIFESAWLKDIGGSNSSYCHPDVEYFPDRFRGYKYWMVFTPYLGFLGNSQDAERYENPTVVVSNDGLNWVEPSGISNPVQKAPSPNESFAFDNKRLKHGFWSDVDLLAYNNKLIMYYRGSFITADALSKRGARSKNNKIKLQQNANRTIVRQESNDGVHWTPLEVAYTSNAPSTPQNNVLVSPTVVNDGVKFTSYEVDNNTGSSNFKGNAPTYIISRTSVDGLNFSTFSKSKIVNFRNEPWLEIDKEYAPWHIQASYKDGYYFLCMAIGYARKSTSEMLYLAYSKNGVDFQVFPKPMVEKNVYRSSVFPMTSDNDNIQFGAVIGWKSGVFKYREFKLNKIKLDEGLK